MASFALLTVATAAALGWIETRDPSITSNRFFPSTRWYLIRMIASAPWWIVVMRWIP